MSEWICTVCTRPGCEGTHRMRPPLVIDQTVDQLRAIAGFSATPDPDALARQSRLDESSRAFAHAILSNPEARQANAEKIMSEAWRLADAWEAERERRRRK